MINEVAIKVTLETDGRWTFEAFSDFGKPLHGG
jgi:hypothetical protein